MKLSWESYDEWKLMDSESDTRKSVFHCEDCDEPIYDGDEYVQIDGMKYCMPCIERNYESCVGEENTPCDYCGETLNENPIYYAIHGLNICQECLQAETHTAHIEDIYPQ